MSENINPHKIDDKQQRRADHLKDKFEDQGMGQDEARKRALEEVAGDLNTGGHNGGGDKPKKADAHRDARGEEQTGGPK